MSNASCISGPWPSRCSWGSSPPERPPPRPIIDPAAVRGRVAELLKARGLVGLSVAVVENGTAVLAEGFGTAVHRDTGSRSTADTMFAIGSITKQFTAACVLLLAEDGKLSVTDKVSKYYPAPDPGLGHHPARPDEPRLGYPDYYPLDFVDRPMAQATPSDEVIRRFGTRPLDFEPGSRYSYSNTGYLILGRIVEKASGQPYGKFLAGRVLKPLGLDHTAYEPDPGSPACARGHMSFWLGAPEIVPLEGQGWVAAAGALFSTPTDLAAWDLALIGGQVLKPESFKLMTTPRRLNDGTLSNYGCGLAMGERGGVAFLSHSGAVNGFHALNIVVPSTRSAAILFSNLSSYSDTNAVFGELTALVLPSRPSRRRPRPPRTSPSRPRRRRASRPSPGRPRPTRPGPSSSPSRRGGWTGSILGEEFDFFLKDERDRRRPRPG